MKSSVRTPNFRKSSLSAADARHSLLLAMAADVERLREQAKRFQQLRRGKERLEGRKISQETAAHEIGVSSRTYRTWEGEGSVLKFENLKAAAEYYGVSTNYIEHGGEIDTPDLTTDAPQLDRIEGKLNWLIQLLAPAEHEDSGLVAGAVAPLLDTAGSPPPKAPARPRTQAGARKRKTA